MPLVPPYDPQNVFAKILRGELPAFTVYEDDDVLAFLDVFPQAHGHTLVIPKRAQAVTILDVDGEALVKVMLVVQRVAQALAAELEPDGIQVGQLSGAAAGQTVPHVHVHVVPRFAGDDLAFRPAPQADPEELTALRERLAARLATEA